MLSVIFDMDGTLLNTQRIYIPAWEYAGNKQGIRGVGGCIPKVCGMNEVGWTEYLEEHFKALDTDTFKKDVNEYVAVNGKIQFKKGAEELISFLKANNIRVGIASGSRREEIIAHLSKLNAADIFDVIVGGRDVKFGKPAPDIFLLAAEKLGTAPKECFVFEDSPNGIRAGYAAGMKCIGIPDVAPFDEDIQKIMFAELSCLSDAIDIFKEYI